jgi:hypothetical protein
MDGGFLTPAKDITWLKALLISKPGVSGGAH